MADFSSTEKRNASWKHLFGLLPTSNEDGAAGKHWYEENLAATHIVTPQDIWTDAIPYAINRSSAEAAASTSGTIVESRTSSENITLSVNGTNWNISTAVIVPKIGFQLTNIHPNPTYIKSIVNVVDLGGGNYTITLNNNTGVSAGSAVLQSRVFLTEDPTSNGLSWFSRKVVGDTFSDLMYDYIQPQRFGQGYTVRVFQADGTEIVTTAGAWVFNWQKGLLMFANGYTADDQGYSKPLYIEGFRYIGAFGGTFILPPGEIHDTLRYNGSSWVQNNTVKADGTNLSILNRLVISGSIIIPSGIKPISSSSSGDEGEVRYDGNHIYVHSQGLWKRASLTLF